MSETKFKPGDTVYVAYLRINVDEVDWNVFRGHCRRYKMGTTEPVLIVDRDNGLWSMAYEEDCFGLYASAVDRLLERLRDFQKTVSAEIAKVTDKTEYPPTGEAS